jgi:photosystem II stability/assembly factor-like uncharacterized protein
MLACVALLLAPPGAGSSEARYQAHVVNPDLVGGKLLATATNPVFLLWGTDATILRSADGANWRTALTPGSADLSQLAANPDNSVLVAVGGRGTILRSIDLGETWSAVRNSIVDTDLLAVTHAAGRTWIAAGTKGRILRSLDDAKSWTLVASRLEATMRALVYDDIGKRVLIGGDQGLVGFSKDAGESWQLTAIAMPEPVTPISGFYRVPVAGEKSLLLATSALGRFLTSADGGDSWDLMQSSSQAYFTDVAFDPGHGVIVLAGHNGDILRSSDGGENWQGSEVMLEGSKRFLNALEYDSGNHALLAAGGAGTLARSIDGGKTWIRAGNDTHGEIRGLVGDPARGRFILFGAGGQVSSSTGPLARWIAARDPLDFTLREIIVTPRGQALVATSRLGDILRTEDAGATWRVVTPNYPNASTPPDLRGLIAAPSQDALVAVGPPGAILRGDARGDNWRVAVWNEIEAERAFLGVLADKPRNSVIAMDARGVMMVSRDDGMAWQRHDAPIAFEPGKFPLWQGSVLESRGVALVAGEAGKAVRSTDGGMQWLPVDTGTRESFFGSFADEKTGQLFLAGSRGTLLRSADLGVSWGALATGSDQELRRFIRDERSGALLCFGTHGTILRSQDDGRTWRAVASGTDGALRKAVLEPDTGHLLVVGSQGTLLRSADGGRSWQKLDTHTSRHFSSIAADPRTGDLVLVGERIVRLVRQAVRQSPRARN